MLILDEIQTGIGRTGKLYHYEHVQIVPDIMTLGKGIGGVLAAFLQRRRRALFSMTTGQVWRSADVRRRTCRPQDRPEPSFLKSVADTGFYLERELQQLSARHGLGEVRGRGLLLALDLKVPIAASIVAQAFAEGVLLNAPRPDALRFMPALNVGRREIDTMIGGLDAILTQMGTARRAA